MSSRSKTQPNQTTSKTSTSKKSNPKPSTSKKTLFHKGRKYLCLALEVLVMPVNPKSLHNKSFWYPIEAITGKDRTEIQKDAVFDVDLNGLLEAARGQVVTCKVINDRPHNTVPGLALVSYEIILSFHSSKLIYFAFLSQQLFLMEVRKPLAKAKARIFARK